MHFRYENACIPVLISQKFVPKAQIWIGAKQAICYNLNQCWPSLVTQLCATRPHLFKIAKIAFYISLWICKLEFHNVYFGQDAWYIIILRKPNICAYKNNLMRLLYLQNMWFLYDACYICSETNDASWLANMVCCFYLNQEPTSCNFIATYAFMTRFPLTQSGSVSAPVIASQWCHMGVMATLITVQWLFAQQLNQDSIW